MRLGVPPLPELELFRSPNPRLTPWAKFCRCSAAFNPSKRFGCSSPLPTERGGTPLRINASVADGLRTWQKTVRGRGMSAMARGRICRRPTVCLVRHHRLHVRLGGDVIHHSRLVARLRCPLVSSPVRACLRLNGFCSTSCSRRLARPSHGAGAMAGRRTNPSPASRRAVRLRPVLARVLVPDDLAHRVARGPFQPRVNLPAVFRPGALRFPLLARV